MKKKLFDGSEDNKWTFVYKTPLESEIEDLKQDLSIKEVELLSANEFCTSLNARFSDSGLSDKSRAQCSLCHLRSGHTKRSCPNGPCLTARQCNDVEKHADEKRQLTEASDNKRKIKKEMEKLQSEIIAKEKLREQVTGTFSSKVMSHLVNCDVESYTFKNDRGSGRLIRSQKVLNDAYILEQHYKGRVPVDLDTESKRWPGIIEDYNKKFKKMTLKEVREKDPVRKRMEDNAQYPVVFPKYADSQQQPPQQQQQASPYWQQMYPPSPWYSPWNFPVGASYMITSDQIPSQMSPSCSTLGTTKSTPSSSLTYSEYVSRLSSPPLPIDVPPQNLPLPEGVMPWT